MPASLIPIKFTAPEINCAEISLFGPGIGECIVLHVGNGQWFIIDSCLCPVTKQPIALEYLRTIGVDAATQVIGILITHWHADHIDGAYSLLRACKRARLYCSCALSSKEAFTIAALYKKDVFVNSDEEIAEFSKIIQFLHETKDHSRIDPVKARHTFFDRQDKVKARLVALSPSGAAVAQAIGKLAERKPAIASNRVRHVVPQNENLNAVAIHFTFGNFSALLGSDLEDTGNAHTGWSAIVESQIMEDLALPASSLYKVAHHGSETGHHDGIWETLLLRKPLSIATPFSRSGLPTPSGIDRIATLSSEFVITRGPDSGKKTKRDPMVEREMRSTVRERRTVNDKIGHIQARISDAGNVEVATNEHCVRYAR